MRRLSAMLMIALLMVVTGLSARKTNGQGHAPEPKLYDPSRDPAQDVGQAVIQASWSGKRILVVVGGDWCSWCHKLDAFISGDRGLEKLRDDYFIVVKVNYSQENENTAFLSNYPKIPGYPHLFVLAGDGKLLYSQDTSELEHGDTYDKDRIALFFKKWAPQ